MKEFKCHVAQKGFFAGTVFFLQPVQLQTDEKTTNPKAEWKKLQQAMENLKNSILQRHASGEAAQIGETVLSILADETLQRKTADYIQNASLSAKSAVLKATEELAKAMDQVDSAYIRSRQEDIRGVAKRLVAMLEGNDAVPSACSAICGAEISPAQLSAMEEALVGGMLTEKGSPNSHASILAGNMGIPYLYGNGEAVREAQRASFIILDAERGSVVINPDEKARQAALDRMAQVSAKRKAMEAAQEATNCKTKIYANIEGPQDIEALLQSGAEGVGLFRTEFLFLGRDSLPAEEEQYKAYCAVLEAMGDKEVIIRTMDIGSDKKTSWLSLPDESNPALGLRGVRVSLEQKALFHSQLRALLRAGVKGRLKVMFPMIASAWEIDEIKDCIQQAALELKKEGLPYCIPSIGIMVETPAAAVCAEELAEKVDFFSIGTNDLTQYTLALDREAQGLERYFDPHHPAVFRLIGLTAEGGKKHGIETGVCGQLAADPEAVKRLIQAGVAELSVPVRKVKATRALAAAAEKELEREQSLTGGKILKCVSAPADGQLIPMAEIPDPVFSDGTMGECFGILPSNGRVYAPVSGKVMAVAETGHAMTLAAEDGMQLLVHVGINTVQLGHKAFKHHVKCGEHVQKDQLLMEADLDMIQKAGLSPMIIVIAL